MPHSVRRTPGTRSRGIRLFAFVTSATLVAVAGALTTPMLDASVREASKTAAAGPFVVESYYRVRWGGEEEFMTLFRKNHLPFLRRQLDNGLLLEVRLDAPQEHLPEDSRWDLRMTLVYPDAATAYRTDKISEADYQAIVSSDSAEARFNREEARRFELLTAHWDINVKSVDVLTRK